MGFWGYGPWENDGALDFAQEIGAEDKILPKLRVALLKDDQLDFDEVIGAADAIAALAGEPETTHYNECAYEQLRINKRTQEKPIPEDIQSAIANVQRVIRDTDYVRMFKKPSQFVAECESLIARLRKANPPSRS